MHDRAHRHSCTLIKAEAKAKAEGRYVHMCECLSDMCNVNVEVTFFETKFTLATTAAEKDKAVCVCVCVCVQYFTCLDTCSYITGLTVSEFDLS